MFSGNFRTRESYKHVELLSVFWLTVGRAGTAQGARRKALIHFQHFSQLYSTAVMTKFSHNLVPKASN